MSPAQRALLCWYLHPVAFKLGDSNLGLGCGGTLAAPMKVATPLVLHRGDQVWLFPAPPRSRRLSGSGPQPGVGTPRSRGQWSALSLRASGRRGWVRNTPKGWASYSQAHSVHLRTRTQTRDDWQGCRLPRRQSRLSDPVGPGLRVSEADGRCCPGTGRWEPATLGFDKNTVLSVWKGMSYGENVTS